MDWNQVEITGNDKVIYSGEKAQKFVEANCPNASIKTYKKGKMVVELPNNELSAKPEVVRGHLEDILLGKAKSIKVKSSAKPIVVVFPVARAVSNVVNVNLAKLKVQFIYKRDANSICPKEFVEDTVIKIEALRDGDLKPLVKNTNKGIADFGTVLPGKYTITPNFSDLDECKYDWTAETRKPTLQPLSAEIVEFEVEPLYQKVQFIAHSLLTIPKQVFVPETTITEPDRVVTFFSKIQNRDITRKEKGGQKRVPAYWKAKYNGHINDKEDIKARVKIVKDTIALAYQKAEKDRKILKIFAIPECFFQGKYGAYKTKNVFLLLDMLQEAVKDEMWKDWIFVFGTVNGSDSFGEFDALGKVKKGAGIGMDVFNISPVFRGGHGDGDITAYRRLIQKATFSAELIGAADLVAEAGLERVPIVSDTVAFQPTENEAILGELLETMAEDPAADTLGIDQWAALKISINTAADKHGLTKLVRDVRSGMNEELKNALDKYYDRMVSHPTAWTMPDAGAENPVRLSVQPATVTATPNKSFKLVVTLLDGKGKLAKAVADVEVSITVTTPTGEETELTAKIEAGKSSDDSQSYTPTAAGRFYLKATDNENVLPANKSSFFVFSRELLTQKEEDFDYRDYVFACARKRGPWLELPAAENLITCKKLNFGLEICADHNKQRLLRSLKTKQAGATPTIDIQFIPSAGMYPADTNIAARNGGYVFNCDGWNVPSSQKEKMRQGFGKFVEVTLAGEEIFPTNPNPLYPHSVLFKAKGVGITTDTSETKGFAAAAASVNLNGVLEKSVIEVIFGEGAGQLHIYKPQDLPK